MFEQIDTICRKNEFVTRVSKNLRRDLDLTLTENKQELAKNIFIFTPVYGRYPVLRSLWYGS